MLTERELGLLLETLCVKYGFCLSPAEVERILRNPPNDSETFVKEVFRAEGLEPLPSQRRLYREVREAIEQAFERASAQHSKQS